MRQQHHPADNPHQSQTWIGVWQKLLLALVCIPLALLRLMYNDVCTIIDCMNIYQGMVIQV